MLRRPSNVLLGGARFIFLGVAVLWPRVSFECKSISPATLVGR
jgi:hypothetical protein